MTHLFKLVISPTSSTIFQAKLSLGWSQTKLFGWPGGPGTTLSPCHACFAWFFRNAGCPELSSATRWRGSWSVIQAMDGVFNLQNVGPLQGSCKSSSRRRSNFMIWEYDDRIKINKKVAYGKKTTAVETQAIYDLGGWMAWSQACLLSIWSWNPIELYQTVQHMTKNITETMWIIWLIHLSSWSYISHTPWYVHW